MTQLISDQRIELLQSMPVFGGIRADILRFLLPFTKHRHLGAEDILFREGDAANSVCVLESGIVELHKQWQGNQYKLKSLCRGDCCGEVSLIDLQPRLTTAVAATDCSIIEISAANLHRLYQKDGEQYLLLYTNMAREVCRRLREADYRAFTADMEALKVSRHQRTP